MVSMVGSTVVVMAAPVTLKLSLRLGVLRISVDTAATKLSLKFGSLT